MTRPYLEGIWPAPHTTGVTSLAYKDTRITQETAKCSGNSEPDRKKDQILCFTDSRQWNCPLVASPAHTGSAPWTPCCPLGRMLCSGPRGCPGLGCLHSLDLCLPPCTPTCAPQREGQPLELSWVLLSWDPERCLVQPCTGPSPGKTLRWVSRVACPRLEVGGVTRNHRPAGLYCHL